MSGIASGTGLISGLDTQNIINQILAIDARPKIFAKNRIAQLQTQQAAYLDLNSRLSALKSAAAKFRASKTFDASKVDSSNAEVLTGSGLPGAAQGAFSFLVSRVVSSQQILSRGFTDRNSTAVGLTQLTIEPETARLDRDTSLSELNGGLGVSRGKIDVTDSVGNKATIDLSRVATVSEVLEALNTTTAVKVKAEAKGTRLYITDAAGGAGTLTISDSVGYSTATSLGIAGSAVGGVITGSEVYRLGNSSALQILRDGSGVNFNKTAGAGSTSDFTIKTRDGTTYQVDVGDVYQLTDGQLVKTKAAAATVGQLAARIAEQTANKVTLTVSNDGQSFTLTDSSVPTGLDNFQVIAGSSGTAAQDLGLVASTSGATIAGTKVLASLNSTLVSNLSGGSGLTGTAFDITARDGSNFAFNITVDTSVSDIIASISTATGGKVTAKLGSNGTSIVLTDTTGSTSGNLIVTGDGATALGVNTDVAGVASATVNGTRLERRYITRSTLLSSLNAGAGIGTGVFEIYGPTGGKATIDIGTDAKTIGDIIDEINSKDNSVKARINDAGDGIIVEISPTFSGTPSAKIRIADASGAVAKSLNLTGEASGITSNNYVDGSFERVLTFTGTETLDDVAKKINDANVRIRASVVNDGAGGTPYRLRLSSTLTGEAGRFLIDSAGVDFGFSTLTRGDNARIFFGSDDPAKGVLVSSTTNSFTNIVDGVTLTANRPDAAAVTLTVSKDTANIEKTVSDFVSSFNDLIDRIDRYTRYDIEAEQGGPLVGDGTALALRTAIIGSVLRKPFGVNGRYQSFTQVGLKIGTGNQLQLDITKFREALTTDADAVRELFAASSQEPREEKIEVSPGIFVRNTGTQGKYTSRGVAELLAATIDDYTDRTNGILTRASNGLTDQIAAQNKRIAAIDVRLESKRTYLTNQFAALEQTLSKLQSQQSALTGLAAAARG